MLPGMGGDPSQVVSCIFIHLSVLSSEVCCSFFLSSSSLGHIWSTAGMSEPVAMVIDNGPTAHMENKKTQISMMYTALSRPTGQGPSRHEGCLCSKGVGLPLSARFACVSVSMCVSCLYSCPSGCPNETAPVAATRAAEPPRDLKNGRVYL